MMMRSMGLLLVALAVVAVSACGDSGNADTAKISGNYENVAMVFFHSDN